MTEQQEDLRFRYLFWFVIGLCLFGMGLSIFIAWRSPNHIDTILTFWLTVAVASGISYLIGSSVNKTNTSKPVDIVDGTSTNLSLDVSAINKPIEENK